MSFQYFMLQHWKLATHFTCPIPVDLGQNHTRATHMLGENIAPWVNDEAVTESLAFTRVRANLSRGDHPGQVL